MRERTPLFLMANLGSEVSQLFLHLEKGERERSMSVTVRAQKIIEELLAHPELRGKTKEVVAHGDEMRE